MVVKIIGEKNELLEEKVDIVKKDIKRVIDY